MPIKFIEKIVNKLVLQIGIRIHRLDSVIADKTLPVFGNQGDNIKIELPRKIINPERIFMGSDIWIGPGSLLMAVKSYPGASMKNPSYLIPMQHFSPKITIGNRVTATANLQISSVKEVTIEDDVMFASNIHINDNYHGYANANEPYKYQKIWRIAPIIIGKGCWIGQNVIILSGVELGEYAIIGANSVVTNSIPPRCIAFGAPAAVTMKWNQDTNKWDSIKAD